jgi:acyl-CoA synthetase (NDP forming)
MTYTEEMTQTEERTPRPARQGRASPSVAREQQSAARMLEARSVALVGASPRPGSFGRRMVTEVSRSPSRPEIFLVNPRYTKIDGRPCYPTLSDLPGPADLVLLGVPDAALEDQLTLAAEAGAAAAVIFGSAHGDRLRTSLARIAAGAGMALCGAGCMGFVNVARGLRAIGYLEPDPLPAGPVALITHSGSMFSALLRSRRAIGYTIAVSSGQELVTAAADYLEYALGLPQTQIIALVLEAIRKPDALRRALRRAAERDIPVVLLSAGASAAGRALVTAHSGALAAADGCWEALARAYGLHRVGDLAELTDTLELFAAGRRVRPAARGGGADGPGGSRANSGIATVHDSGLERAHAADLADELGVPFAALGEPTLSALSEILDPGLEPGNPLDVWGTGADTREQLGASLRLLAHDPAVTAVALAVDLVPELDGDRSYPLAALDAAAATGKPVAVLAGIPAAIDPEAAAQLRASGVPVLEGMRSGLLALRHLTEHGSRVTGTPQRPGPGGVTPPGSGRLATELLASAVPGQPVTGAPLLALLREYGIATARVRSAADLPAVLASAEAVRYPVVLKTDEPGIAHKTEAGGVVLGIAGPDALADAYAGMAGRLGPRVLVCQAVPPGVELSIGLSRDPALGPLIVVGAGGVLVELLADRAVALPPVSAAQAIDLLGGLRVSKLLSGARGGPAADIGAIARAVAALSGLAADLGERIEALDINPLICGPSGAVAVDALLLPGAA